MLPARMSGLVTGAVVPLVGSGRPMRALSLAMWDVSLQNLFLAAEQGSLRSAMVALVVQDLLLLRQRHTKKNSIGHK